MTQTICLSSVGTAYVLVKYMMPLPCIHVANIIQQFQTSSPSFYGFSNWLVLILLELWTVQTHLEATTNQKLVGDSEQLNVYHHVLILC